VTSIIYSVHDVIAEEIRPFELIEVITTATFVIFGHLSGLLQASWTYGILIEMIPNGGQCQN
jgi:hypothetical protein